MEGLDPTGGLDLVVAQSPALIAKLWILNIPYCSPDSLGDTFNNMRRYRGAYYSGKGSYGCNNKRSMGSQNHELFRVGPGCA